MLAPEYDHDEATFRWHLCRAFGRMIEIGSLDRSRVVRRDFCGLLGSLEEYCRLDTQVFIDAVRQSAERWLAGPARGRPWIASFDFDALDPDGLDQVKRIWPRDAVMWGATSTPAITAPSREDLARRSAATEPYQAPPSEAS